MNAPYKFAVAPAISIPSTLPKNTLSYIDRMFSNFDQLSGKSESLPVRLQDGKKFTKISDAYMEPNTIPVITNFGAEVEDFEEQNGLKKGETILIIGGNRQGKFGQGRMAIPMSEIDNICDTIKALGEAVKAEQKQ